MNENNDSARMTVIINIDMMSKSIGIKPMTFDALWSFNLDQLRAIQESLIAHDNRSVKQC